MSVNYILTMGSLYLLGAVFYVQRIPERWAPGYFDYWLHSHQIFHCLVLSAALIHLYGVIEAYGFWTVVRQEQDVCSLDRQSLLNLYLKRSEY